MTLSTIHHVCKIDDNNQKLECVVDQYILAEPVITTVPITVFCKYIIVGGT